jgi:hypothetical protein
MSSADVIMIIVMLNDGGNSSEKEGIHEIVPHKPNHILLDIHKYYFSSETVSEM